VKFVSIINLINNNVRFVSDEKLLHLAFIYLL